MTVCPATARAVSLLSLSLFLVLFLSTGRGYASSNATVVSVRVLTPGGIVRSTPRGIECPPTCAASFDAPVQLDAIPDPDWAFDKWGRDCAPAVHAACAATISPAFDATVSFRPAAILRLDVDGAGRVTSRSPGIDPVTGAAAAASCDALASRVGARIVGEPSSTCAVGYRAGQRIVLSAEPIGSALASPSWSQYDCPPAPTCTVTMADPGTTVRARFAGVLLAVVVKGRGRVTSTPAGIDCGTVCFAGFTRDSPVRLVAIPGQDPFSQWDGFCGTNPTCDVTLTNDAVLEVSFGSQNPPVLPALVESAYLTTHIGGLGTGSVTVDGSESGAKDCSASPCSKLFRVPEAVSIAAEPDASRSRFDRWVAGCPATRTTCRIDTRFTTSLALCFALKVPPQRIQQVRVNRANGNRRLVVTLAPLAGAKTAWFSLVRSGVVRAAWKSLTLPKLPGTVRMAVPRGLVRGSYVLRTRVVDPVGCGSTLAPHAVVLPKR